MNEAIVAIDISIKDREAYLKNLKPQLIAKGQKALDRFPRTAAINNHYAEIGMKINQLAELMKNYSMEKF